MPNGGNIHINISYNDKEVMLVFLCSDQGHGIEEEQSDKIFQPFFTTKSTGTGLGLSHVYKVIESHGGTIEVVSIVGEGTTFKFILPLQKVDYKPF